MSIVYVTQIPSRVENGAWVPTIDISPAREYGELEVMLPSGMNAPTAEFIARQFRTALSNFNPHEDYLLTAGDPVAMVVAAAILGGRGNPFMMLKWDRHAKRYLSYEIEP